MSLQLVMNWPDGPIGRATEQVQLVVRVWWSENASGDLGDRIDFHGAQCAGQNALNPKCAAPIRLHHTLVGRLGDQLFQWASISGIASLHGMQVCLDGGSLAKVFEGAEHVCTQPTPDLRVSEGGNYAVYNSFQLTRSTFLDGYLQSWRYFYPTNVRSSLKFKPAIERQAAVLLSGFGSMTLVGIHVRYTLQREGGYLRFPPLGYFQKVMTYFRSKFTDVLFVVASQDTAWCLEQDVFAASDVRIITQQRDVAVEMAILAGCDHVAITVGTFGWWAAYLGADAKGGEVVYYDSAFDMEHPNNRGNVVLADYYPPEWTAMGSDSDFKLHLTCVSCKSTSLKLESWRSRRLFLSAKTEEFHRQNFASSSQTVTGKVQQVVFSSISENASGQRSPLLGRK